MFIREMYLCYLDMEVEQINQSTNDSFSPSPTEKKLS